MVESEKHEPDEEELYLKDHPEECLFKEVLGEAVQYRSYEQPPQVTFELANQVRPTVRPLVQLLMHEYQEYLHQPAEVDVEEIFVNVCSM